MAVMIRPRDLDYRRDSGTVELCIHAETEKERQSREEGGLSNLTKDVAKVLQSELRINKNVVGNKEDVVYFETIKFLVQTIEIRVMFSHFLKVSSFFYNLIKIMNQQVTKVHYVFEAN